MVGKAELEACKERGIGDFRESAEIPKFFAQFQQEDKQGVRRDRKNLLEDEGREEPGKRIIPFATELLIKSMVKGRWNEQRNIKMLFEKLKKGWAIIHEHVLAA